MSTSFTHPWLAIAACAMALTIGSSFHYAHAGVGSSQAATATGMAIDQPATRDNKTKMAACKRLPLSERGTCEAQAGYGQAVMSRSLTPAQQAALDRENDRYKKAAAECGRLPVSDRTMCMSQAGSDRTLAALQ